MKGKARLLGHPIHPMLIVLPLGLLPAAVVCDFVHLCTRGALPAQMAYWLIAGGIAGGLLASVFGFADWLAIPSQTRAKRIGALHAVTNVAVMILFGASWFLRHGAPENPRSLAIVLGVVALLLAAVSGWLGAELIYRLNVGVDEAANPNAPSSLHHEKIR